MTVLPVWQSFKKVKAAEIERIDAVWANKLDVQRPDSFRVTVKVGDASAGVQIIEGVPYGVFAREIEERGSWDRCIGGFFIISNDGTMDWCEREAFLHDHRKLGQEDAGGGYIGEGNETTTAAGS